jgi:transcriptional regulator with XRE-family HTH domain/nitroreductase
MLIGQRLRELRESKNLSQRDIEQRTGMFRCYTSRVENGHTVPSIETLVKSARALEVPLYKLFYKGEEPPKKPKLPSAERAEAQWGAKGNEREDLHVFPKALSRMHDRERMQWLSVWHAAIESSRRRLHRLVEEVSPMKRKASFFVGLVLATIALSLSSAAQDLKPIKLPPPQTDGGRPLMQVLKDRKSTREFGPATLSPQTLSNLLWAAFGINRPDERRTAPSAMNWQEVSIYMATPEGVYIYYAKDNTLNPVLAGDVRAATGTQSYVKDAAVNLVYVSDLSKTGNAASTDVEMYTAADVGFIAQNVYLYCASEGLATVVRASIDKPALAKTLNLQPNQKIILAQSVGYPKK